MTGRKLPEWIGSSPDAAIPPRVRLRVFEAAGGVCAETGRKIQPGEEWDCDHRIPLAIGGEHRESNLQPVLRFAHRQKTALDVKAKAKAARLAKKHVGIKLRKAVIPGSKASGWKRRLDGTTVRREEA